MVFRPRILPTARDELEDIVAYLSGHGAHTARRFTNEYRRQVGLLASGVVDYGLSNLPELAALGYHACLVNSYVMLYYYTDDEVVVAHIFHQSRDYARLVIGPTTRASDPVDEDPADGALA